MKTIYQCLLWAIDMFHYWGLWTLHLGQSFHIECDICGELSINTSVKYHKGDGWMCCECQEINNIVEK